MEQTTQLRGDPQRSEAVSATPGREVCGNYVLIRKAESVYAFHANMQKGSVAVAAGQQMAARAVIGWLGNSGNSTNLHLHFGLLAASARNQGGDRWESSRRSVAVLVH